jgi:hypothetical protein
MHDWAIYLWFTQKIRPAISGKTALWSQILTFKMLKNSTVIGQFVAEYRFCSFQAWTFVW